MDAFLVALGFGLLACHEMDAVRAAEWRLLPGLSRLADDDGYRLFTLLHVPIFAALLWALVDDGAAADGAVAVGLDVFSVIHAALHVLLRNVPENGFRGVTSWVLILGAAVCGVAHLTLVAM